MKMRNWRRKQPVGNSDRFVSMKKEISWVLCFAKRQSRALLIVFRNKWNTNIDANIIKLGIIAKNGLKIINPPK